MERGRERGREGEKERERRHVCVTIQRGEGREMMMADKSVAVVSSSSAGRPLVHVFVGQCGAQIGETLLELTNDEIERGKKGGEDKSINRKNQTRSSSSSSKKQNNTKNRKN